MCLSDSYVYLVGFCRDLLGLEREYCEVWLMRLKMRWLCVVLSVFVIDNTVFIFLIHRK